MTKHVNVLQVGLLRYAQGLDLQAVVKENVRSGKLRDTLILLQHRPVYTVGLRHTTYTAQEEIKLRALGADFHRTNRGGLITFHGPGQLVVYPIMDLRNYEPSVRWYVSNLEKSIIKVCETFGLEAYTSPHTGVWVRDAKICAMGVHASRYLTTHGLALNCNTDLNWFSHIVPCGIPDKQATSLSQQLSREVTVKEVAPIFLNAFERTFNVKCKDLSSEQMKTLQELPSGRNETSKR